MQSADKEKANAPMPWIGLYVAAASLICSLAMAADVYLGFRNKRLWFPCKFFTLNAASLTLLAVALKLPVDLTTDMSGDSDWLAKNRSIAFMCTVMGNFMPSLGQMNNKDIITNLVALGIIVVTIIVNIWIQISTGVIEFIFVPGYILLMLMMLVLFVLMSSSALHLPSTRKYIDLKYREFHNTFSSESVIRKFDVDKLKEVVRSYWMMAQTGSPQFVMARSVMCIASGAICVIIALITVPSLTSPFYFEPTSSYKWSIPVILVIQTSGVLVGAIACAFRVLVFTTIKLKSSTLRGKSFKTEFIIENYWIEKLVEWKEKPLPLKIQSQKGKRLVHDIKNLFMCFCLRVQIVIVVMSKSIQLLVVLIIAPFLLCYHYWKQLKRKLIPNSSTSSNHSSSKSAIARKMDLNCFALCLEGENEMPGNILNNICDGVDRLIQMGKKQEPKNLKELLKKSTTFKGIVEFDKDEVPSLISYEPPNSWMMPVVTLTSIAIALPNIANRMVEELLSSVSEGLIYMGLVEKDLDGKGDLINLRNAAEVMWLRVELSQKWLDQDLRKMASKEENSKGTLQSLAETAKNFIVEFKENAYEMQKENPLEWPVKAISANSMYRMSNTLLLDYDLGNEQSDEKMFQKLSVMISDILVACLTNLPRVITMKCYCSAIEKKESIQQAAHLLGETEEILKILQQRELPSLNQDQAACIDEWRAVIQRDHNFDFVSSSNNDTSSSGSIEIHIASEQEDC